LAFAKFRTATIEMNGLRPKLIAGRDLRGGAASASLEGKNRSDFNLDNRVYRIVNMGAVLETARYFKGLAVPMLRSICLIERLRREGGPHTRWDSSL